METIVEEKSWKSLFLIGILCIILGVVAIVWPDESLKWFLIIIGILMLVGGGLRIYDSYKVTNTMGTVIGAIMVVLGLVLVIVPNFASDILVYLAALFFIIFGIVQLADGSLTQLENKDKIISMLIGLLFVIVGVLMIVFVDEAKDIIMWVIGAILIIGGLLSLYNGNKLRV